MKNKSQKKRWFQEVFTAKRASKMRTRMCQLDLKPVFKECPVPRKLKIL